MSDLLPSYPCQQVVGEGELCGMPCEPGFVRCTQHRSKSDRNARAKMLEEAHDRIIRRVETVLDDAVERLIHLAREARSEQVQLQAIDKLFTLTGFANVRLDAAGAFIEPDDRDRVLMGLIRNYVRDPHKLDELEQKAGAIDVKLRDGDDDDQQPDTG